MRTYSWASLALTVLALPVAAQTPHASYPLDGTLAALEPGRAPLVEIDPLGQSQFENDVVLGEVRPVWRFGGASGSNRNGGLELDASGVSASNYSVELIFEFDNAGGWRKLVDTRLRSPDIGFYVSPSSRLHVYCCSEGTQFMNTHTYYHVVLTHQNGNESRMYLNGAYQATYNGNNMTIVGGKLFLFLDDGATGFNEYTTGRVALVRLYEGALTPAQVTAVTPPDIVDSDGDGVPDGDDVCAGYDDNADDDDDGIPNGCDDSDGDGVPDSRDVCPGHDDAIDVDFDGIPDGCDACPLDPDNDDDGDGVCGDVDVCPGTAWSDPGAGVPSAGLGVNRWADMDGDGIFDTTLPAGTGPRRAFTIVETGGCNCAQIIESLGVAAGHRRNGCSIGVMQEWIAGQQ